MFNGINGKRGICTWTTIWNRQWSLTYLLPDIMAAISQWYFQIHFRGPIDNNSVLFWIMAWRRRGDKPLSEPMLTRFTDAYMRHKGLGVGWRDELTSLAGERASISLAASHCKIAWNFVSRWLSVKWYLPLWNFVRGLTAMLPNRLTNVTAIANFKRQYLQGLVIEHMINTPVILVY